MDGITCRTTNWYITGLEGYGLDHVGGEGTVVSNAAKLVVVISVLPTDGRISNLIGVGR